MKIAILDDYANVALSMADWGSLSADITVFNDVQADPKTLAIRLLPFDIICLMRERTLFDAALIKVLPNLKLIVTSGPKNVAIDVDFARKQGIEVSGTQSRKTPTPELAMLMMLALNRGLMSEVASLHSTGWQAGIGRDLAGLTLGLIGLGRIGQQMAVLGRAFGMDIVAWSENLTQQTCDTVGVTKAASLTDLMSRSDVASIHLVLSERTHGLIGKDALSAAKDGLVLINTSRGPIVESDALLAGLRVGRPAKAGLDVYDFEPLVLAHPLRDAALIEQSKLLLTPHLGYATEATFKLFYTQTVEAIAAWKEGTSIRLL